jgi:hypothetical protein
MSIDIRTKLLVGLVKYIAQTATQSKKRYCIGGGFSIDFSLGKITRSHEDIDLVVDVDDADWWMAVFKELGYIIGKYDYIEFFPDAFTVSDNSDSKFLMEVWAMKFRSDGTLYPPHTPDHLGREWWNDKKHGEAKQVQFEGVIVNIENPSATIDQKLGHVRHHKETLSPKHQHDMKLMNRMDEYERLVRELGLKN